MAVDYQNERAQAADVNVRHFLNHLYGLIYIVISVSYLQLATVARCDIFLNISHQNVVELRIYIVIDVLRIY